MKYLSILLMMLFVVGCRGDVVEPTSGGWNKSENTMLSVSPLKSGPFDCSESSVLTYIYSPVEGTLPARGYEIRLQATGSLSINANSISINVVPVGATVAHFITENGFNDFTISYAILGWDGGQIDDVAELFTLEVHGIYPGGIGTIDVVSLKVRTMDNQPIDVIVGPSAVVIFDCVSHSTREGLHSQ